MNQQELNNARAVATDMELENGSFVQGERYYIRTPTYHYVGTLVALTPMVFVLRDAATIFETGPIGEFLQSKGEKYSDGNKHDAIEETCVDRAGSVAMRFKR